MYDFSVVGLVISLTPYLFIFSHIILHSSIVFHLGTPHFSKGDVVNLKNTTSPFFTFLLSPTKIPNHGNHLFYNLNRILPELLLDPCNN